MGGPGRSLVRLAAMGLVMAFGPPALAEEAPQRSPSAVEDLRNLSIEQLGEVRVTSVEKSSQALSDAPASIYVITHDQIIRSGATTLPEILRLAPNLFVAQTGAASYTITARGFAGDPVAQEHSNKLLVLIDGRSVYSPLFSGVQWDMQGVVPEDVDRIEVISGPGATLWGANAVNGVINIITRKAYETEGLLVDVSPGTLLSTATIQLGGQVREDLSVRAYVRQLLSGDTETAAGASAGDDWFKTVGGIRADWTPTEADDVLVEADAFDGRGAQRENISGEDFLASWRHAWASGSALEVKATADHAERGAGGGGEPFWIDNFDLALQYDADVGARHHLVAGAEVRVSPYAFLGLPNFYFTPARRTLVLADVFVQDSIALVSNANLILGAKMEDDPYSGASFLPSVRATWRPAPDLMLWASAQRAIRSPTPFDEDVNEKLGNVLFLVGDPRFHPETLDAYELGVRAQASRVSLSLAGFYNVYDDLRSIEVAPGGFIPLRWGNRIAGHTYGLEAWGSFQALPWWRLSASVDLLKKQLHFLPGASGLLGISQAGDDPSVQATFRSSMDLGRRVTLDASLRYVGDLPAPAVPAYAELNVSLGWAVTDRVRLSITGFNLLHDRHLEFASPDSTWIPRSAVAELRWRF